MRAILCAFLSCAVAARAQGIGPPPLEGRSALVVARATVPLAALPAAEASAPPPPLPHEQSPRAASQAPLPNADPGQHPWRRRVHLLSRDDRVELRRKGDVVVCRAPCDAVVEFWPDDEFHLGGSGLTDSPRFTFALRPEDATLDVHPRSSSARAAGIGIAILGVLTEAAGDLGLLFYSASCSSDNDHGGSCGAGGLLLVSAAAVALGFTAVFAGASMTRGTQFDVR
jgi:hypothetical protein